MAVCAVSGTTPAANATKAPDRPGPRLGELRLEKGEWRGAMFKQSAWGLMRFKVWLVCSVGRWGRAVVRADIKSNDRLAGE